MYNEIKMIIPLLEKIKSKEKSDNFSVNYIGKEGMKTFFELILSENKPLEVIGATGKALKELEFYFPHWHKTRIKRKISTKVIFNDELRGDKVTIVEKGEVRFLSKKHSTPSTMFIFGNYVGNLLWEEIPTVFIIKSKKIAESYRKHFKLLWKIAKK